eukprot:superscaffoldBa00000043_g769
MAVHSGPPTQMAVSGEITHIVIILETPGEPEQERRWEIRSSLFLTLRGGFRDAARPLQLRNTAEPSRQATGMVLQRSPAPLRVSQSTSLLQSNLNQTVSLWLPAPTLALSHLSPSNLNEASAHGRRTTCIISPISPRSRTSRISTQSPDPDISSRINTRSPDLTPQHMVVGPQHQITHQYTVPGPHASAHGLRTSHIIPWSPDLSHPLMVSGPHASSHDLWTHGLRTHGFLHSS